jgi:hypothetical protein
MESPFILPPGPVLTHTLHEGGLTIVYSAVYVRHRPEKTLLYQLVNEYWPEFQIELASQDKHLLAFITQKFEEYLRCGRFEHGRFRIFTNDGFGSISEIGR